METISFDIAGIKHRSIAEQAEALKLAEGDNIYLQREPFNKYDRNAIAVYTNSGTKIGYVPRALVVKLAPRFDIGCDYTCVIDTIYKFDKHTRIVVHCELD